MTEPQQPRSEAPRHPSPEELSVYAYSPQEASAGLREHTHGCVACAAEVADLRLVLATLADLPEPELPAEVGIGLDAALDRAWQEADAERAASAAAAAGPGHSVRRRSWRRFAMPLGALGLIAAAGVGIGFAVDQGGQSHAASGASGSAAESGSDAALSSWVRSVLPSGVHDNASNQGGGASPQTASGAKATANHSPLTCASYPARAGYKLLTAAEREFDGRPATLVVYQNGQEPASATVLAVVYAGSCPTQSSQVLDEGVVSR